MGTMPSIRCNVAEDPSWASSQTTSDIQARDPLQGLLMKRPTRMRKHPQQERSLAMVSAIRQAAVLVYQERREGKMPGMKEIGQRAGASLGSVYQYYENQESVIAAIYEDLIVANLDRRSAVTQTDSDQETLMQLVKKLDQLFQHNLGDRFYGPLLSALRPRANARKWFIGVMASLPIEEHYWAIWQTDITAPPNT